jgi:nicotinamidase-related amidase
MGGLVELVAPSHTAVILQELQQGVLGEGAALGELAAAAKGTDLAGHADRLSRAARVAGVIVVHCTAEDLPHQFGANHNARLFTAARALGVLDDIGMARLVPDGISRADDIVLPRYHGLSPMTGTQLDSLLRNEGIKTVVIAGVSLNFAIPNLVFDAVNRSYQAVVVSDAVVGLPVEYGEQVLVHTIRPLATLATASEVIDAWSSVER